MQVAHHDGYMFRHRCLTVQPYVTTSFGPQGGFAVRLQCRYMFHSDVGSHSLPGHDLSCNTFVGDMFPRSSNTTTNVLYR